MATETVIYVSLALVLLTRIYVFISPPEFLEEHKDRRYHEYHLYRQYHLHKQYDKNDPQHQQAPEETDDGSLLSRRRRRSSSSMEDPLPLEALHHPSDEFVLLERDGSARPFPLRELSLQAISKLDPITAFPSSLSPLTPTSPSSSFSATTTPYSPRESERGIWNQILGSSTATSVSDSVTTSEPIPVPSYLSLDISEIHYNGSLQKFDQDLEVQESIRELKAGQRDINKECPTMTMVWEGGRWCCLEGRTLYILQAMEWQGQVRVRVLVDKDPMMLAVTEDCWRAAGMTSEQTPTMSTSTANATVTSHFASSSVRLPMSPISPISPLTPLSTTYCGPRAELFPEEIPSMEKETKHQHQQNIQMAAANTDNGIIAMGLSLDNERSREPVYDSAAVRRSGDLRSPKARFSLAAAVEGLLMPVSPAGHDADDEGEDEEDEDVESDGYLEDDEGDAEEDQEEEEDDNERDPGLRHQLEGLCLGRQRRESISVARGDGQPTGARRRSILAWSSLQRPLLEEDDNNASDLTAVSPSSPSPSVLHLPKSDRTHPHMPRQVSSLTSPIPPRKSSFGILKVGGEQEGTISQHRHQHQQHQRIQHQHHERKISIPEFMLPPPLKDEQAYLIIDPGSANAPGVGLGARENPPRRDSGHDNSP